MGKTNLLYDIVTNIFKSARTTIQSLKGFPTVGNRKIVFCLVKYEKEVIQEMKYSHFRS